MKALLTRLRGIKRLSPVLVYISDTTIIAGRYMSTQKGLYRVLNIMDGTIVEGSYIYPMTETELLNLISYANTISQAIKIKE